jgi:hypothetical protein
MLTWHQLSRQGDHTVTSAWQQARADVIVLFARHFLATLYMMAWPRRTCAHASEGGLGTQSRKQAHEAA